MSSTLHRARYALFPWVLGLLLAACAGGDEAVTEIDDPEPLGEVTWAATVQQAVSGGCSTAAVLGLSQQIVDQVNCLVPGILVPIPARPNFKKSSTTFAFLQAPGRDALVKALDANPGKTMNVTSMLRTVAQQYVLYAWGKTKSCGVELAATPGTSNHESGQALDTSDYASWKSALQGQGFKWFGTADDVHFDYTGAGAVNLKGKDVLAFQILWNRNHPDDTIGEDGAYGPQTEARLKQSPADGFPKGAQCDSPGTGGAGGAGGTGTSGAAGKGGAGAGGSGGSGQAGAGAAGQPGAGGVGEAGQGGSDAGEGGEAGSGTAGSAAVGGTAGSGVAGSGQAGSGVAGSGVAGSGVAGAGTAGSGASGPGGATGGAGGKTGGAAGTASSGSSGQAAGGQDAGAAGVGDVLITVSAPDETGGCGCRAAGGAGGSPGALAGLAAVGLTLGARRRSGARRAGAR